MAEWVARTADIAMESPSSIDKRLVRRRFDRAAPTYDQAAVLQREVGRRMLDRLDLVKLTPEWILDAGSGTGWLGSELAKRYPTAGLLEVDLSLPMLQAAPAETWWGRVARHARRGARHRVCADMEQLPLRSACVQLACSNLALAWSGRPQAVLGELQRVIADGGLLMFTTFGPDTLKELRAAYGTLGAPSRIQPFIDMHDLGDMLVASGFTDPVMDMEHLTLTYADCDSLLTELRNAGGGSALASSAPGLRGRGWRARLAAAYESARCNGRLPLTVEIVHGHAWKLRPRRPVSEDGRAVIRLERRPHVR